MDYKTMMDEHQAKYNAITSTPEVFFAYNNDQLHEGLARATEAGVTAKFCAGPCGMFGTRKAMDELVRLTREHRLELLAAMEDPEFAVPAFKYEMFNREYAINWDGFEEVMGCFNYELGPEEEHEDGTVTRPITHIVTKERITPSVIESFNKARREYYAECGEY